MKKFAKELFAFSIPVLVFLTVGLLVIFFTSNRINYRLSNSITEVYIGDSHLQCAVNDSLLNNSKNFSTSSESFYFSYYKLKKIIEENPAIKRVYLGFSYHSLSGYYDKFIDGEYSSSVSPKYFYVLPFKEKSQLVGWNIKSLPTFIKGIFSTSYSYLHKDAAFATDGYANRFTSVAAKNQSMEKRLNFQFFTNEQLNNYSEVNLLYLNKIVNLCTENKIDLLMLNTPLHRYYKSKIPSSYIAKYNEIVSQYNLKVIDFKDLSLSDSCFIPDGDHVSVKGAYQVTQALAGIKR